MTIGATECARWLHLPIEWFNREFPSKLLVAAFAAERGFAVTIGDQKLYRKNVHRLPTGLYFRKSFKPNQSDEIHDFLDRGFTVIGADEESFIYYGAKGVRGKGVRADQGTMEAVHGIFAWGEKQKALLVDEFPSSSDKIHVTGTPRLDLYRSEFRHIYEDEAAQYRSRIGPFILLNSNFAIGTSPAVEKTLRDDLHQHEELASTGDGDGGQLPHSNAYFERYIDYKKQALAAFVDAIPMVKDAFPEHRLVIRPHPADGIDYWRTFAAKHPGVIIKRENHVAPWLLACDAMFHHGCSTAVEGWVLGTPVVGYHPDHDEHFTEIGGLVGADSTGINELIAKIDAVIGKRDVQREGHEWLEEYFAGVTGRTASERTVDALDQFEIEPAENRYKDIPPWAELRGSKRLERQWRYLRDRYLKRPQRTVHMGSSWRPQPKWPDAITKQDMESMIAKYAAGHPEFASIRVDQLDDALFVLTN